MRTLTTILLLMAVCVLVPSCHAARSTAPGMPADRVAAFDSLWVTFDREYSYFEWKRVDWSALRDEWRPVALSAASDADFRAALAGMLAPLRDRHVVLIEPGGLPHPTWVSPATPNWNPSLLASILHASGAVQLRPNLGRAVIRGVPYIGVGQWNPSQFSPADLDSALAPFRNASALVIDVRGNPGGDDQLAFALAGRFATLPVVTEYVHFRNGPLHSDFGPEIARTLAPRGPWTFTAPVVVLAGRGCLSSNESFVSAMRELPNVTVLGDTTGGASGDPVVHALGGGWSYTVSTWIASTADRRVIEWQGIPPDVMVPWDPAAAAGGTDPVLEAALARLGASPRP